MASLEAVDGGRKAFAEQRDRNDDSSDLNAPLWPLVPEHELPI